MLVYFCLGVVNIWNCGQVAEGLRQRILSLYNEYLAPNGKGVNYKKLAEDPAFAEYVSLPKFPASSPSFQVPTYVPL
jgi:hypothetical protein